MPQPPTNPKIYHIVHIDKLPWIIAAGCLRSDAAMATQNAAGTIIGMKTIKKRRLSLPVHCHQGLHVGDFVPFYFCPRSVMLYMIHMANDPELIYRGGQGPIIHMEADLNRVVAWADTNNHKWAFSLSNAGAFYAQFRSCLDQLNEINWPAVGSNDFRSADRRSFFGTIPFLGSWLKESASRHKERHSRQSTQYNKAVIDHPSRSKPTGISRDRYADD